MQTQTGTAVSLLELLSTFPSLRTIGLLRQIVGISERTLKARGAKDPGDLCFQGSLADPNDLPQETNGSQGREGRKQLKKGYSRSRLCLHDSADSKPWMQPRPNSSVTQVRA